jgi:hypothetical protein
MKKMYLTGFLLVFTSILATAQIYKSKEKMGHVHFFSSTPMENIEANTKTAASILNSTNDSIMVRININTFEFEKSLMQEHFNENYMETPKFPYSILRGKIQEKIDYTKDGTHNVSCNANLTVHGVTKPYILKGTLAIKNSEIQLTSKFDIKLKDHNIEVPKLVLKNIAESIAVDVDIHYAPFVKK